MWALALVAAAAAAGGAIAGGQGNGNSANAPGQQRAQANCSATIDKQGTDGTTGRFGQQPGGVVAPTNCDHSFNS
jgi:hypothetical protein